MMTTISDNIDRDQASRIDWPRRSSSVAASINGCVAILVTVAGVLQQAATADRVRN